MTCEEVEAKIKDIERARDDAAFGYGATTTQQYARDVKLLLDERARLLAENASLREKGIVGGEGQLRADFDVLATAYKELDYRNKMLYDVNSRLQVELAETKQANAIFREVIVRLEAERPRTSCDATVSPEAEPVLLRTRAGSLASPTFRPLDLDAEPLLLNRKIPVAYEEVTLTEEAAEILEKERNRMAGGQS